MIHEQFIDMECMYCDGKEDGVRYSWHDQRHWECPKCGASFAMSSIAAVLGYTDDDKARRQHEYHLIQVNRDKERRAFEESVSNLRDAIMMKVSSQIDKDERWYYRSGRERLAKHLRNLALVLEQG